MATVQGETEVEKKRGGGIFFVVNKDIQHQLIIEIVSRVVISIQVKSRGTKTSVKRPEQNS